MCVLVLGYVERCWVCGFLQKGVCKGLGRVKFRLDSQVNFLLVNFCSWNYILSFLKTLR